MARSYRPVDRFQQFLLPPDMAQWLPSEHLVWFLIDVVDELDMGRFEALSRRGGVGRQGYDPRMLLGLLIYAYATGQRSSRLIEGLCGTDVAFRVLCAQDAPDHSTIARFRQRHQDAVADLFVQVLALAGQAGLGRVGVVAVDGTKIAANASPGANRKRSWLRRQVDQMMAEAEQTDAAEDEVFGDDRGDEFGPGWADRATRRVRIKAALARAEAAGEAAGRPDQAKVDYWAQRAQSAQRKAERARQAAQERFDVYRAKQAKAEREGTGGPTGTYPSSADEYQAVKDAQARVTANQRRRDKAAAAAAGRGAGRKEPRANTTDPDSGPMPTTKGWIQGYNAQLVVSDDQIIMAAQATQQPGDVEQFVPMMAAATRGAQILNQGRAQAQDPDQQIGTMVLDAGYLSEDNLHADGPDRLIATGKRHNLEKSAREPQTQTKPPPDSPVRAMSQRLRTPAGIGLYRRRGVTVEPVNGHLKDRIGLRQFSRRGIKAVQAELELAAATANLLKIYRHTH